MKSLTLLLLWVASASYLFAQKEVIVQSSSSDDKVVSVNVMKEGDDQRKVTIVTDENGEEQTIEWTDNGEIPEDIRKKLEAQGIDISMIEGDGGQMMIRVDADSDAMREVKKDVIVIKKGDDGEVMEFEWDGEGEMPAEMKELMDEHDIHIDMLHEGHGDGKVRKHKMRMKQKRHKAHEKGRHFNMRKNKEYKVVTIDEDGDKKVNVWVDDDGGLHEFHGEGDNVFMLRGQGGNSWTSKDGNAFFFSDEKTHLSDAYMGAHIESADNGARIVELIKDGPADKAGIQKGDIVTKVNGARARNMDGLLEILNFFEPNDQVEVTVSRDGKERTMKMTLVERPDAMK